MTPFERYVRMLEGKTVDFVPRTPILMQFAAEFIGSDYGRFASELRIFCRGFLLWISISSMSTTW